MKWLIPVFRSPVLVAEFLNGERHWQSLHNYSCDEVISWWHFELRGRNRGVYYSQRMHILAVGFKLPTNNLNPCS